MAEYIDREKLLNELGESASHHAESGREYQLLLRDRNIVREQPTADIIERSTMEILCNEYLSKCNCCDECCAETYCILNSLRTENRDCVNNLITYFTKRNIGENEQW